MLAVLAYQPRYYGDTSFLSQGEGSSGLPFVVGFRLGQFWPGAVVRPDWGRHRRRRYGALVPCPDVAAAWPTRFSSSSLAKVASAASGGYGRDFGDRWPSTRAIAPGMPAEPVIELGRLRCVPDFGLVLVYSNGARRRVIHQPPSVGGAAAWPKRRFLTVMRDLSFILCHFLHASVDQ
jgi:hypothetical protein